MARPRPFCECKTSCNVGQGNKDCADLSLLQAPGTDVEIYVPAGIFATDLCSPAGADDAVIVTNELKAPNDNPYLIRRFQRPQFYSVSDKTYNVLTAPCAENPIASMYASGSFVHEFLGDAQTTFSAAVYLSCNYNSRTRESTCAVSVGFWWRDFALIRSRPDGGVWSDPYWTSAGYHYYSGGKSLQKPLAPGDAVLVKGGYAYESDPSFNSTWFKPGRPLFSIREDAPKSWVLQF